MAEAIASLEEAAELIGQPFTSYLLKFVEQWPQFQITSVSYES
jgi:hypothetical protein